MGKLNASPWAVKKINTRCATNQVAVYQKRLNEEAEVLKGINHPNIVGKQYSTLTTGGQTRILFRLFFMACFSPSNHHQLGVDWCMYGIDSSVYIFILFCHIVLVSGLLMLYPYSNTKGFRAIAVAKDGSKCLAMEYGGEQSLNDLIEKRKEDGLKAFPAAKIEKVALHVARGLQVNHTFSSTWCYFTCIISGFISHLFPCILDST